MASSSLLDLRTERAALHSALAAYKHDADVMTKSTLVHLLTAGTTALSETAATRVADSVFANGSSHVSLEALVSGLVPPRRVPYEELYDSELAAMRDHFSALDGGWGTIDSSQLDDAVSRLPGLHHGPMSSADRDALVAQIRQQAGGRVDLPTLVRLVRQRQQQQQHVTTRQLTQMLQSFDAAGNGLLPLEKATAICRLFRPAGSGEEQLPPEVMAALKASTQVLVEPPVFIQPEIQRKVVDCEKLVAALMNEQARTQTLAASEVKVTVQKT